MLGDDASTLDPKALVAAHRRDARIALVRAAAGVAVLLGAFAFLPLRGERSWFGALIGGVIVLGALPLSAYRLRRLLASERPIFEAFETLVLLLAWLTVGFAATAYALNYDGTHFSGLDTRIDAMYFAVITLSTVGYGDVVATSQAARLLVTVQIVFNLLFVGVAVRIFTNVAKRRATQG